MSTLYEEVALPELSHFDARPDRERIATFVRYLAQEAWVAGPDVPRTAEDLYGGYNSAEAESLLHETPVEAPLTFILRRPHTGLSEDGRWPEDHYHLEASLCEYVEIVDSPTLLLLPAGMNGETFCPACGENIGASADSIGDEPEGPFKRLALNNWNRLPSACPACSATVDPRLLWRTERGRDLLECPCLRFAAAFKAVHQPPGTTYFDIEFLAAVSDILGVPTRSVGLWK